MVKEFKSKTALNKELKNKTRKEQEAYLHPRIIKAEMKKTYNVRLFVRNYS